MDRVAVLFPGKAGEKVTVIVWLFPAAMEAVAGDTLNGAAPIPVTLMSERDKTPHPVLLIMKLFCVVAVTGVSTITKVSGIAITGPGQGLTTRLGALLLPIPSTATTR